MISIIISLAAIALLCIGIRSVSIVVRSVVSEARLAAAVSGQTNGKPMARLTSEQEQILQFREEDAREFERLQQIKQASLDRQVQEAQRVREQQELQRLVDLQQSQDREQEQPCELSWPQITLCEVQQ